MPCCLVSSGVLCVLNDPGRGCSTRVTIIANSTHGGFIPGLNVTRTAVPGGHNKKDKIILEKNREISTW